MKPNIPNPENKPCVCHKDNNPLNNDVDNLYWGTVQENISQKVRDGRAKKGSKFSNRLRIGYVGINLDTHLSQFENYLLSSI